MRIILLGAPGSGKGTQGRLLSKRLGVAHVSSGELLREHIRRGSDLGSRVAGFVRRGELVPDDLVLEIVGEATRVAVNSGGYILDGFPRTLPQALRAYEVALVAGVTAHAVVHLQLPDDAVSERLAGRASTSRPEDRDPQVTARRLALYHADTEPLLDFYRQRGILVDIDATAPPTDVALAIATALDIVRGAALPPATIEPGPPTQ